MRCVAARCRDRDVRACRYELPLHLLGLSQVSVRRAGRHQFGSDRHGDLDYRILRPRYIIRGRLSGVTSTVSTTFTDLHSLRVLTPGLMLLSKAPLTHSQPEPMILESTVGLCLSGGIFTTLNVPGASPIAFEYINNKGMIVDSYNDFRGWIYCKCHGFVVFP